METIICKSIQPGKTFKQGYVTEANVLEGSTDRMIGYAEKVLFSDTIHHVPTQIVHTHKEEGRYRIYFNTSDMQENSVSELLENLQTEKFKLNCIDLPFFENKVNIRKVLLLIDESNLFNSLGIIDLFSKKGIETEIFLKINGKQREVFDYLYSITNNKINLVSSFENDEVESLLDKQLIGTRIFISGSWSMIDRIKEIASTVGFTDEEIQYSGYGKKNENVYCVKCYSYNKVENTNQITCEHCNTVLDVSKHFSKRLNAYLGYIQVG